MAIICYLIEKEVEMMRFVLSVLIIAGQVTGITPEEIRKSRNYVEASRSFIERGDYPESSNDLSEKNKEVFGWVKKIVDGSIKTELKIPEKVVTATWLVGDRIDNLLGSNKLQDAEKLIENLRYVDKRKADHYSNLLQVYQQNYHQEEKMFHFVETNNGESSFENSSENRDSLEGGAERKNPWTDLFLKWSTNTDS